MARRVLLTGVQGSGKTTLLRKIKEIGVECSVISGSDALRKVIPNNDLSNFDELTDEKRTYYRGLAAAHLKELSRTRACPLIVDGHLILRNRNSGVIEVNWNEHDELLYTEIISLRLPPVTVLERRLADSRNRSKTLASVTEEVDAEAKAIDRYISSKNITVIRESNLAAAVEQLRKILEPTRRVDSVKNAPLWIDNSRLNEENLLSAAKLLSPNKGQKIILLDADRTLSPDDTAAELYARTSSLDWGTFCSGFQHFGYHFEAFREAIISTSMLSIERYTELCKEASISITMFPNAIELLKSLKQNNFFPVVVTCGSVGVWQNILQRNGFDDIPIFGGSHFAIDNFLIGKAEKGVLATYFRERGHEVIAIGDSELDELMMRESNIAIIAHNHKENRDLLPGIHGLRHLYQWSQTGESRMIPGIEPVTYQEILEKIRGYKIE